MSFQRKLQPKNVFVTVMHHVKAGTMVKPKWLRVVRNNPPYSMQHSGFVPANRIPRLRFFEDRLLDAVLRKYPEAADIPFELYDRPGTKPMHPVNVFVRRQAELIKSGLSKEEAFAQVEAEMDEQRRRQLALVALTRDQALESSSLPLMNVVEELLHFANAQLRDRRVVESKLTRENVFRGFGLSYMNTLMTYADPRIDIDDSKSKHGLLLRRRKVNLTSFSNRPKAALLVDNVEAGSGDSSSPANFTPPVLPDGPIQLKRLSNVRASKKPSFRFGAPQL